jgi:hypothetical protein
MVKVQMARSTSARAHFSAFPASAAISRANSSFRSRIIPAARSRISARRQAGRAAMALAPSWAAATAASTSSRRASGTSPITSPVYLSRTGIGAPPSTHWPPMKSRAGPKVTRSRTMDAPPRLE